MKKIIEFGKVAYNGKTKRNLVTLKLELQEKEGKTIFTASGNVWNGVKTDIYMGGQCIDDIWSEYHAQLKNPKLYKQIMELWKKWHLKDMHAECEHQEAKGMTWETNQSQECEVCGWKLGHGWSYRAIPSKDLDTIKEILARN